MWWHLIIVLHKLFKYENDIKLTDKQIMVLSILKMSEHNILQNNK